jgi:hypothetical protein
LRERLGLPQGLIERATAPKLSARKPAIKAPSKVAVFHPNDKNLSLGTPVLKGHGFSRAAKSPKKSPALAAEGMQIVEKIIPQGLKLNIPVDVNVRAKARTLHSKPVSARLKPRPFKARRDELRGIPPLPQKQTQVLRLAALAQNDRAPRIVGASDTKRGRKP